MKTLVTGVKSGLGRFIHEQIGGLGLSREKQISDFKGLDRNGVDVIIHCAANQARTVTSRTIAQYTDDNLFLTKKLVTIPHKKFVYLSTVDIYPHDGGPHNEEEILDINKIKGVYAITKIMCESMIQATCSNWLILRPATLVGSYSRENTLMKIINSERPTVGLRGDSIYNYVLHQDVAMFIQKAVDNDITGIFNLASSENIALSKVADIVGKTVTFGDHLYNVGNINNSKARGLMDAFGRSSLETLRLFLKGR